MNKKLSSDTHKTTDRSASYASRDSLDMRDLARRRLDPGVVSEDRNFVKALARGLMVLETFNGTDDPWLSITEITERVGLPKPTVTRFVKSLSSLNYLFYSENLRKYRLNAAVLTLGFAAREPYSLGELVRPFLKELADDFNIHAALAKRDSLDAIHVEVCHSLKTLMTLQLEVGSRIPLAGTATGMALITALPETERDYLMKKLRERHKLAWPSLEKQIAEAHRQIATQGYVATLGSWHTDINGVATPLLPPDGSSVFALVGGAPALHFPPDKQKALGERLLKIRKLIEEKLNSGGGALSISSN